MDCLIYNYMKLHEMQQTMKYTSPIMKFININISQFHGIPRNSMELARSYM